MSGIVFHMTQATNTPQVRNITKVMREIISSDDVSVSLGMTWYNRARAHAALLDPNDVSRAAGILAALSPLNSWPQNMRLASEIYAGKTNLGYLHKNVAKALRIYNGEMPLNVLGGNKVRSFYLNIIGDDSLETVTVDRHAVDIACGRVCDDKVRSHWTSGKRYWFVAGMYVRAAKIINAEFGTAFTGAQIQAITWVWWRKNKAAANHGGDDFGA
jgi:hypothetical protein